MYISADFDLSDNASALNSTCQQFSVPSYMGSLTLVSCVLSMIGSVLTMLTFCIWKDFRTVGRAILVFLAIADFFTAFGYMFGVSVTWAHDDSILKFNGTAYGAACTAQSFLTSFFPVSSFIWTFNLAVYLFAVIVIKTESRTTLRKMFVLFHLAAWGIPTLVCIIGVGFHMFGPSSSLTSVDWCFIRYDNATARFKFFLFEALCGKFWEICTYIASLVMYIVVKWNMKKFTMIAPQTKYLTMERAHRLVSAMGQFDRKLLWIPIIFILFRIWGTIRFFISFSCDFDCLAHCPAYTPALVALQSIFDPAQGWGNALLFVVFHRPVLTRVCPSVVAGCDRLFSFCLDCLCCTKDGLRKPLLGNKDALPYENDTVNSN